MSRKKKSQPVKPKQKKTKQNKKSKIRRNIQH